MKEVSILIPCISVWSGTSTIPAQDIDNQAKLPPKSLLAGGKLALVPAHSLSRLNGIKRHFSHIASKYGFVFNGLNIIPRMREDDALTEIQKHVIEAGQEARTDFLATYDAEVAKHMNAIPEWAALIEQHRLSRDDVAKRIVFECVTVPFIATDSSFGKSHYNRIQGKIIPAFLADVAATATEILEGPVGTRDAIPLASIGPIRQLSWKMRGFSLLDPRIGPACDALDRALKGCPTTGPTKAPLADVIKSLVVQLSDIDTILSTKAPPVIQPALPVVMPDPSPKSPAPVTSPAPAVAALAMF